MAANTRGAIHGAAALALSACSGMQSALHTGGPGAARIARLWWLMFAVAAVVYVVVVTLLLAAIARRRHADVEHGEGGTDTGATDVIRWRWIVGGVAVPAVVLIVVFVATLRTQAALLPASPTHAGAQARSVSGMAARDLTIQVVGRLWWWEITYPGAAAGEAVVTANELHIPTGRRVRLELTSTDVIHSLWVPALQGKTDLVPGRTTVMWLQADRPGVWRGQCAEYCGLQHARMAFLVVAEPPTEFERWLGEQRRPAAVPVDSASRQGQSVFLASGCGYCHAVQGMRPLGGRGPDLTHLASRRTLAAGTLTNTRQNLAAWLADPQRIKPGNKMPRVPLTPSDFGGLVSYLQTLR